MKGIRKETQSESVQTTDEWALYEKGVEYNRNIGLYDAVDEAEAYYAGDQWRGVDAGGLPTPVFNIFKRVINYFTASILSQPVKLKFCPDGIPSQSQDPRNAAVWDAAKLVNRYVEYRWEKDKMDAALSDALIDAAVTGDACAYVWWDTSVKTGQPFTGDFRTAIIDNVNILPGDPNTRDVEKQPYILLVSRENVEALRREAEQNGGDAQNIAADTDDRENQAGDMAEYELEDTKATCVILFRRDEEGKILWKKSTKRAVVRPETDTRLTRYPVAWMNWDRRKNSWHGRSVIEGLIQNQRYINKAFALLMKHMMDTSFSKTIYNATIIDSWTNTIGEAIPATGDVSNAAKTIGTGSVQTGYIDVIQLAESMTRDLMGASDAALGNVKPENTSAIIALQQASAVPLENVKRSLYQFVEDLGLIWLDYILHYYDDGRMLTYREDGETKVSPIGRSITPLSDMGTMHPGETETGIMQGAARPYDAPSVSDAAQMLWDARVDVGPSYYWSEAASISTLSNLLQSGAIDMIQYLERMPDIAIPQRRELIEEIRQRQSQAEAAQAQQAASMTRAASMTQAASMEQGTDAMNGAGAETGESAAATEGGIASVLEALPEELRKRLEALPEEERAQAIYSIVNG